MGRIAGAEQVAPQPDRKEVTSPQPEPLMSRPLPIPLAHVRPELLTWLWPGYIPRGKLTILDGDPNLGKSLTTLDLAARMSRGLSFPDGRGGGIVGRTLILQAEDDTAGT